MPSSGVDSIAGVAGSGAVIVWESPAGGPEPSAPLAVNAKREMAAKRAAERNRVIDLQNMRPDDRTLGQKL